MDFLYRIKYVRKGYLIVQNAFYNLLHKGKLGNRVNIFGLPVISIEQGAQMKVGRNVTFISASYFSEPGISHPVTIRLLSPTAVLTIGDNVGISGGCVCVQTHVSIGSNVLLGANVSIVDTDFHPVAPENRRFSKENIKSKPIRIGNNVFIGMNTIVLKGVEIGDNSVIGAGSVITRNIPANQVWGGNPAVFIKALPEPVVTV